MAEWKKKDYWKEYSIKGPKKETHHRFMANAALKGMGNVEYLEWMMDQTGARTYESFEIFEEGKWNAEEIKLEVKSGVSAEKKSVRRNERKQIIMDALLELGNEYSLRSLATKIGMSRSTIKNYMKLIEPEFLESLGKPMEPKFLLTGDFELDFIRFYHFKNGKVTDRTIADALETSRRQVNKLLKDEGFMRGVTDGRLLSIDFYGMEKGEGETIVQRSES